MLNSLFDLPYFSFLNYFPRGKSNLSVKSRTLVGNIKAGRREIILSIIKGLAHLQTDELSLFFSKNVGLVPIPRSSLIRAGDIWPAFEIATILLESGHAMNIMPILKRTYAVRKSSGQAMAEFRPSVLEHYESIMVTKELTSPSQITLVDDVLTLGRMSYACAWRLHEIYPTTPIRLFSIFRTQGFIPNIEKLVDPQFDRITFNKNTGKTTRHPN